MRQGQTSIEYVLAMVGLLILLTALYEVSVSMNGRLSAIQSRMEGMRVSAQMSQALDWAEVIGPGANISIQSYSFPAQRLILNRSEIIILDENDQAVGFGRHLGFMKAETNRYANESVSINNSRGNLSIFGYGS